MAITSRHDLKSKEHKFTENSISMFPNNRTPLVVILHAATPKEECIRKVRTDLKEN